MQAMRERYGWNAGEFLRLVPVLFAYSRYAVSGDTADMLITWASPSLLNVYLLSEVKVYRLPGSDMHLFTFLDLPCTSTP